jgi:hypothetical protein
MVKGRTGVAAQQPDRSDMLVVAFHALLADACMKCIEEGFVT